VTVNPLVAARIDQPKSAWAGVWIAEDIELIAQGVENRSWVDGTLGVAGGGLDALALVSDPVGALLQYGIAWLIEHVKPLSEALDWLAGDPGQIAGHAHTWRNVASELRQESDSLARAVRFDLGEWEGAAAEAYRNWADKRDQSLQALAKASDTMALITEGAGMLIGTVRIMVRDAVATVVSRLIGFSARDATRMALPRRHGGRTRRANHGVTAPTRIRRRRGIAASGGRMSPQTPSRRTATTSSRTRRPRVTAWSRTTRSRASTSIATRRPAMTSTMFGIR
jgi:uncharacterized protein YukE